MANAPQQEEHWNVMNSGKLVIVGAALLFATGCSDPALDSEENIDVAAQSLLGDNEITVPIAYWKFDTCAGNVVPNEQGPWGTANLAWGASCGVGAFGQAGVFDGIDDRAWVSYDSRLDFSYEMSISAWVSPTGKSSPQTIVGKWDGPDSYLLWLSSGQFRFSVALADGRQFTVSAPAVQGSVFSEVVASFSYDSLKLKVNGNTTSISIFNGTKVPLQSSTRNVTIGNHPSGNAFAGRIDEVKLFDVANPNVRLGPTHCAACNPPSNCCDP